MLAVLGGLADVEHDLIRTRTAEGRSRAKAQGKAMGRPPSLNTGTAERGHQAARGGRYAARIGAQLQRQPGDDFTAGGMSFEFAHHFWYAANDNGHRPRQWKQSKPPGRL